MTEWQWHQLDHVQVVCNSLQTDNHASTSSLKFFTGRMLFLLSQKQRQSNGTDKQPAYTFHDGCGQRNKTSSLKDIK